MGMRTSSRDIQAFAELARRRRHLLFETFGGCRLKIGKSEKASGVKDVVMDAKDMIKDIKDATKSAGKEAAESLLKKLFDGMDWVQVIPLVGDALHQIQKEVTTFLSAIPCLGSIEGGAKAIWYFGNAAERAWTSHKCAQSAAVIRAGDPRAACHAVVEIIDRARNENIVKGSINATHAAASAGMFFVDGGAISGPALSAAKTCANLCQSLYLWGRDIKEMIKGNEALGNADELNADVFKISPVLGAYLMTESNTSDLLSFMISDIGLPQWMSKIESLLPELNYVQDEAGKLIRKSRLGLEGLQTDMWKFRGLSRWEKFKNKFKSGKEKVGHVKDAYDLFQG
ncbi:MAG: hypothetical protein JO332_12735 [Planctomycetaceae bacterium]|nr:hypothetical protein [Planctomycetaceae bacterium]